MWSRDRKEKILALLRTAERARTAEIASQLGVSRETVRRDLLEMQADGLLQRVHGGAVPTAEEPEAEFQRRKSLNWPQKMEIGRKAAALVKPGMIIYVDAGSTTLAFAHALRDGPPVKVITNSCDVAQMIRGDALLLGGRIVSDVPATFGELTLWEIERFMADFAFVSPTAVSPRYGPMYYELHESEVARAMCRNAQKVAVLADGGKLGGTSRVAGDRRASIDYLVTDSRASDEALAELADIFAVVM